MQNGTGELEQDTECVFCNFSPPLRKGGGNSRKKTAQPEALQRRSSREAWEHDF